MKFYLQVCHSCHHAVVSPTIQPLWHQNNTLLSSHRAVNHNLLSQCARFLRLQFAASKNTCRHLISQTAVSLRQLFFHYYIPAHGPCSSWHNCVFVIPKRGSGWSEPCRKSLRCSPTCCRGSNCRINQRPMVGNEMNSSIHERLRALRPRESYLRHSRAALVCVQRLSKHAPHIYQQICTFRGSAQCFICGPLCNQRPLQMIINALRKAPGGPRKEKSEWGFRGVGVSPQCHFYLPLQHQRGLKHKVMVNTQQHWEELVLQGS